MRVAAIVNFPLAGRQRHHANKAAAALRDRERQVSHLAVGRVAELVVAQRERRLELSF